MVACAGCSVGESLAAYFNTYYNARRLFSEAENELLSQRDAKQTHNPLLAPFAIQSGTRQKLTTVIEKCSKLLQYHPQSSLVDDALMMIGKSYYYQNDYQKAERKFIELLDGFPESDLVFESQWLLVQTYYKMNDKPNAAKAANTLIDASTKAGEEDFPSRAYFVLAQIEVDAGTISEAAKYYQFAADRGTTSEERAFANRNLGEMLYQMENYKGAANAYRQSYEASSDYVSEVRARLGLARTFSKAGQYDASLDELEELRSNANNKDFFGEIDLEIANTYRDMNDLANAVAQYAFVDTTYVRTEVSANSYYQLGLLYETMLFQYDSARAAYNKGVAEFAQAKVTALLAQRAEYLNKYFRYLAEIAKYDSMRAALLAAQTRSQAAEHDTASRDSAQHGPVTGPLGDTRTTAVFPLDSLEARLAYYKTELGGLFYSTIGVTDSAEAWYRGLLRDHPGSIYVPRALFTLAQIYSQDSAMAPGISDSLYREIVARFPETEFAAESRRLLGDSSPIATRHEVAALYAEAEKLLQKGMTLAAIDTFKSVVHRYASSPLASKAQYAIGWVYEQVRSEMDSAIVNYRKLVTLYPSSEYAQAVRPRLDQVDAERRKSAVEDSLSGGQSGLMNGDKGRQLVNPKQMAGADSSQHASPPHGGEILSVPREEGDMREDPKHL